MWVLRANLLSQSFRVEIWVHSLPKLVVNLQSGDSLRLQITNSRTHGSLDSAKVKGQQLIKRPLIIFALTLIIIT